MESRQRETNEGPASGRSSGGFSGFERILRTLVPSVGPAKAAALSSLAIGIAAGGLTFALEFGHETNLRLAVLAAGVIVTVFAAAYMLTYPAAKTIRELLRQEDELAGSLAELSRTRTQLEISEKRFRHIAESASDWFWEMGPDLRFSYFS